MDLKKFEYQRAEYVKAFKILDYISVADSIMPDYYLLDSGMANMPFAVIVPDRINYALDAVGKYFVMYDDEDCDILDKTVFQRKYIPRT